jgi:RecA-family ATPase
VPAGSSLPSTITESVPERLVAEIRESHARYGTKFAILDNLQFFSQIVEQNRERQEQDRVIREFVQLVKEIPVHIFLVVHSRKADNDNQRIESLSELKGSKTLVDEASNVFALNKPKTADIQALTAKPTDRELLLLKLRKRGRNTGKTIHFYYDDGRYDEKKVTYAPIPAYRPTR